MKKILFIVLVVLNVYIYAGKPITNQTQNKTYKIMGCVIDHKVDNNPAYFHFPNKNSKLICENTSVGRFPTITTLYKKGWRLIEVVSVDSRLSTTDGRVPSSLLYFEK